MHKYWLFLFLLCICICSKRVVYAQVPTAPVINLEEVIISTNKLEETKSSSSGQISLITAKDIAEMNVSTVPDVLQQNGEVFVQRSQLGGGSPVVRGFEANKVLLVVDGVRMNNIIFRSGHLQNVLGIDPFILNKAEIIHGAGSVIYGSDALGGVLSFFSTQPPFTDSMAARGEAVLRYSSAANEKTLHVNSMLGWKNISSLTAFTISDFDDLIQGRNRSDNIDDLGKRYQYAIYENGEDKVERNSDPEKQVGSAFNQYYLTQKLNIRGKKSSIHKINLQGTLSSDIPRYDRLSEFNDSVPVFAEWYYGPSKRFLGSYQFELDDFSKRMADKAEITIAYQFFEESRNDRKFQNNWRNERTEKIDVLSSNVDFLKRFDKALHLSYGIEYLYNNVESNALKYHIVSGERDKLSTRYPDGGTNSHSGSAYAYFTMPIKHNQMLKAGARAGIQHLSSSFFDKSFFPFPYDNIEQENVFVSSALSYQYNWSDGIKFDLSFSNGFRNPNLDDVAKVFDSSPGNVIVPNPDITPEKTYGINFGVTYKSISGFEVEGHAYYTIFSDIITTIPFKFNGEDSILYDGVLSAVFAQGNKSQAYIYGSSITSRYQSDKWKIVASGSYTFGRIETDTSLYPLDHIPPIFGRISVSYLVSDQLSLDCYMLANATKRLKEYSLIGEDNYKYATPQGMPAWYTLNTSFRFEINKHWSVQSDVQNILDRNYRVFSSGISAAGRNFIFTVRCKI